MEALPHRQVEPHRVALRLAGLHLLPAALLRLRGEHPAVHRPRRLAEPHHRVQPHPIGFHIVPRQLLREEPLEYSLFHQITRARRLRF